MFGIEGSRIYDCVETIYATFGYGKCYCKYNGLPYHDIVTDEEKTYLLNNWFDVDEMIHITDEFTQLIYHDRFGDAFITYDIVPNTLNLEKHMAMVDSLFTNLIDPVSGIDRLVFSSEHYKLIRDNSYRVAEYE